MPKDIADGRVSNESVARVSEETANRLGRHKLKPRSIVLPRRGEITKRAFINAEQEGWLCGTGCLKIEFNGMHLIPEYLYYFMEQGHVVQWLVQHAVGTTMLNLSASIVAGLPIRYPEVGIQRKIVDVLMGYDDLIENNRRRMALLEESARLLYQEWFVRLRFPGHEHTRIINGIPEGWEGKVLGDICDDLRGAVNPDAVDPATPYIGLEHIPRRSISLSEWGRVDAVTSTKLRYMAGDIIFGKIRPYFHKVGIAFTDGVTSSDAIVIRPNSDALRSLVLMTVSSDPFVAEASQTMREGSKMPRADWKLMRQYPIVVPHQGLLEVFSGLVTVITDQLCTLCSMNQKLKSARDLLLTRLMKGEIAV